MNIIYQTFKFLNSYVLPIIPAKHSGLFCFEVQALTLQSFVSLNSNARSVVSNRSTAESKIFRLVSNTHIPYYFTRLVKQLKLVTPSDVVNVDFSSFAGFELLTLAKQTQQGRSLPLYFELIRYPVVDPSSQTIFIINTVKRFKQLLGFCPKLVV